MMFPAMWVPLLSGVALTVGVTTFHRRLIPSFAAKLMTISVTLLVVCALPTMWVISIDYLAHLQFGHGVAWCADMLGMNRSIPAPIGLVAVAASIIGLWRSVRVLRATRRLRHDDSNGIEIADHQLPFAYTLPGRGGRIVLSSGLLELLDPGEQRVVIAHEQAHAINRHDRYLLVGRLANANLPILILLVRRLQFTLERWADEAAVDAADGDRNFVAYTLSKVALNTSTPAGALAINRLGIVGRVADLLAPARPAQSPMLRSVLWAAIAATAVVAGIQLDHAIGMLINPCLS